MLAEVLHWIGVPGQIVLLVSFVLGAYHLREVIGLAALAGMWVRMALVFVGVLVVGVTGVVPGFSVHVDVGVLYDHVDWLWRFVPI